MAENEQVQTGDAAAAGAKPSAVERVQKALDGGGTQKVAEGEGEKKPEVKPPTGEKKPEAAPEGFASRADVEKMVADGIKAAMDASKGERASADVRQQFIIKNMGDLPMFAQDLIPKTGDLKELGKAEQDVRQQLGDWIKKAVDAGKLKIPDVGGGNRDGGTTAANWKPPAGTQTPMERVHNALNKTT